MNYQAATTVLTNITNLLLPACHQYLIRKQEVNYINSIVAEIELALKNQVTRQNLINLYLGQLKDIIASQSKDAATLELVFYLCHKLQFYGQFTS